jgi:hypothetical protein
MAERGKAAILPRFHQEAASFTTPILSNLGGIYAHFKPMKPVVLHQQRVVRSEFDGCHLRLSTSVRSNCNVRFASIPDTSPSRLLSTHCGHRKTSAAFLLEATDEVNDDDGGRGVIRFAGARCT